MLGQLMLKVRRQSSSCAAMTIPHKAGERGEPVGEPKHWRKFRVETWKCCNARACRMMVAQMVTSRGKHGCDVCRGKLAAAAPAL